MAILFESVLAPIETAKGLPNAHYIDPNVYSDERKTLFFDGWAACAFAADAPGKGDVYPIDFVGAPLLLVNGRDGKMRVFQNTCRHRGMILVDEPKTLKGPIRCPYHSWSYDHDGRLVRTPYVGGVDIDTHDCIDPEKLSLFEVPSYIWHGVVFVNVSGNAQPFEQAHSDALERWREFDKPFHVGGAVSQFEMTLATNWKLAIENFCESYHLPWIHPELNEISSIDDHYPIDDCPGFSGQGSLIYNQLTDETGRVFPDFEGISEKWKTQSEYISFFPNVLLGVHRDHAYAMILLPKGPESVLERTSLFYAKDIDKPEWQAMLSENARIWRDVFSEDIGVVEGMQKGRHGPLFDGGKFSPVMDGPTHIFHKWVATKMQHNA